MSLPKEGYIPMGITKSTYQILCQLVEGDKISIEIKEKNTYQAGNPLTPKILDATIIGFNTNLDYPIKVVYDIEPQQTYSIPLQWLKIDEVTLRDIKLNRILDGMV